MKTYYYFDEVNDDFANLNINTQKLKADYEYLPKSKIYKLAHKLTHIFLVPLVWLIEHVILLGGIKNKKVLKQIDKKQGYFVYGNHTSILSDAFSTHTLAYPKETYVISNEDSVSIKGIAYLVRCLGALPLPTHLKTYMSLLNAVDELVAKGSVISIYPEAHIWPYYNSIRNFPDTSFHFPYRTKAPVFCKTTIYKKGIIRKVRPVIYLDGPFYIDYSLPKKEAMHKLRNEIYDKMNERVIKHNSLLHPSYRYQKVNSKEEVRTEITK